MRLFRVLASVLILVALVVGALRVSWRSAVMPESAPCSSVALAAPFRGPFRVRSVASFGCVGPWAYLWATVGRGVSEVGVTEVLYFDRATGTWESVSRLRYCHHGLLPRYVEYRGCNSN